MFTFQKDDKLEKILSNDSAQFFSTFFPRCKSVTVQLKHPVGIADAATRLTTAKLCLLLVPPDVLWDVFQKTRCCHLLIAGSQQPVYSKYGQGSTGSFYDAKAVREAAAAVGNYASFSSALRGHFSLKSISPSLTQSDDVNRAKYGGC